MIHFLLLINRVGKCRLQSWYDETDQKDKAMFVKEIANILLSRSSRLSSILEYRGLKIIYRKYASLYFVVGVDPTDNEFINFVLIHQIVELLDQYYGNVCELDLVFTFHKVCF